MISAVRQMRIPGRSMFTYLTSFVRFDFGLGAAVSWLMLLMALLMCLSFIAVIRRREVT